MSFLTNLTLGKKIVFLTTLGLLFAVGVFSSLGIQAVNQATEAMLQDRLTTARLVADYLDEALGRALNELDNTARLIERDGAKGNLESHLEALGETYSRLFISIRGIYLLDEAGRVIWRKSGSAEVITLDIFSYPTVSQATNGRGTSVSGLLSVPLTDVPVILLTGAVKVGGEGGKGALVVLVDPAQSSIGGFVQPIRLGQTGYIEIVDQNGIVVARTEPGPKLAPFERSDHSGRFATLISVGKPSRGVCHTCHVPEQKVERKDVLAFVPLSKAKWGVVVRQSEAEALAATRQLRRNLLFSGVGLVTIALAFVIITTRDIGGRIKLLTSASRKMAEGDLASPVNTLGKDEVGILAHSLDDTRIKLKTSYDELKQRTKELSSLLSVSEILTRTFDLPRLFDAVMAKAVEIIPGADGGALLLRREDRGNMVVQCAVGLDKTLLSQLSTLGEVSSDTGQKGMVCPSIIARFQSPALDSKVQSAICADVFHRQRNIGNIIIVSFGNTQAFSESEQRLLQAIADSVAIAIERAQLTKEAEEARAWQEADRLKSQFISSVSHELRAPLTLIKGYSTSLLRQDISWSEETQREFLQIIDQKTDELRDLIDKLLQSAKLEAGALKLEKEPLLIPRLVQRIVDELASRATKHKLTLKFAPHFLVIEADVRCMEQVLRNLVENAIKYSPEGGEITISGEVKEDEVVVCVSDQGVGIPPEHQSKVFERFHRVDNPLCRGIPGSGLGLSIVKGNVEAHGGKVWLESTVGKGSKFYFSLPLSRAEVGE